MRLCLTQVNFIKQRLRSDLRQPAAAAFVEVATIDAFQGREADVVLLSCVRAPWHGSGGSAGGATTSGVGFLQDVRRMNVGLTRARRSLWILGHVESLVSSRPWRALIEHAGENLLQRFCLVCHHCMLMSSFLPSCCCKICLKLVRVLMLSGVCSERRMPLSGSSEVLRSTANGTSQARQAARESIVTVVCGRIHGVPLKWHLIRPGIE